MPCARIPVLKVFSANGLFDLATPFLHHRVRSGAHGAGSPSCAEHRVRILPLGAHDLLNLDALKQLKSDLAGFYSRAVERVTACRSMTRR